MSLTPESFIFYPILHLFCNTCTAVLFIICDTPIFDLFPMDIHNFQNVSWNPYSNICLPTPRSSRPSVTMSPTLATCKSSWRSQLSSQSGWWRSSQLLSLSSLQIMMMNGEGSQDSQQSNAVVGFYESYHTKKKGKRDDPVSPMIQLIPE